MRPVPVVDALTSLGEALKERGLSCEFLAIGGGALTLLGLIDRPTRDIDLAAARLGNGDLVDPEPLPTEFRTLADTVAKAFDLGADWINTGPRSLLDLPQPEGFLSRLTRHDFGGLTLWIPSRDDFVVLKTFASIDSVGDSSQSRHADDLRELGATLDEVAAATRMIREQFDSSHGFAELSEAFLKEYAGG